MNNPYFQSFPKETGFEGFIQVLTQLSTNVIDSYLQEGGLSESVKENQTFKAYTESYKYCIIVERSDTNTENLLSIAALLIAYCNLRFLHLPQQQSFFSS